MSSTGGVGGSDGPGPGMGSDNGGGNESNNDTGNDVDTSTTTDNETPDTEPDPENTVNKANTVDKSFADQVKDVVNDIMDAIENITGIDIPDDVRSAISDKVASYASMTVEDIFTDIIETVLGALGVPAAGDIAESIVNAITDPTATLEDLGREIAQHLANAGLNATNMNPVAKAVVQNFINLADPQYGFGDLMGDMAALGFTVAAHTALGAMSLGMGNVVAGAAISKAAGWVDDQVTDHINDEIAKGNVVNPGEEGYDISHGPGHDKGDPKFVTTDDGAAAA